MTPIYGVEANKMTLFQKICPKKCTHALDLIIPGLIFFGF